jgi:hypothetical protein
VRARRGDHRRCDVHDSPEPLFTHVVDHRRDQAHRRDHVRLEGREPRFAIDRRDLGRGRSGVVRHQDVRLRASLEQGEPSLLGRDVRDNRRHGATPPLAQLALGALQNEQDRAR